MPHLLRRAKVPRLPARHGQMPPSTRHQARRLAPSRGENPAGEAAAGARRWGRLGIASPPRAGWSQALADGDNLPGFESRGNTTLVIGWPPRLNRASQECTPIIPSNHRSPHSLHRSLREVWKRCMAGTSHRLLALQHERRPQMFFRVLGNYFFKP